MFEKAPRFIIPLNLSLIFNKNFIRMGFLFIFLINETRG